jgi:carboxylesterase type B
MSNLKMRLGLSFFAFIVCLNVVLSEIVVINDGKVEGTLLTSRLQKQFYGFFKIPYAEPPVKDLRFQAPRPVKKWTGFLDASKPGPICFQQRRNNEMSEDCLHINVFTRNLTKLRPVIVFIHGGSFEFGSALDQGN